MLSHECGYLNDTIRANCGGFKKRLSAKITMYELFECGQTDKDEGKIISPEYATKLKPTHALRTGCKNTLTEQHNHTLILAKN